MKVDFKADLGDNFILRFFEQNSHVDLHSFNLNKTAEFPWLLSHILKLLNPSDLNLLYKSQVKVTSKFFKITLKLSGVSEAFKLFVELRSFIKINPSLA